MPGKKFILLILSFVCWTALFSQHVQEGIFDDWSYGPTSVTGNLPLPKIGGRKSYKIERIDSQTVTAREYNPSGVIKATVMVNFVHGILNRVERMDAWGDVYEYENYSELGPNHFRVTDLEYGKNSYLPCKYVEFTYSGENLMEVKYYSFEGKLTERPDGYAIIRYKRYDDKIRFGQIKEISFFNAKDTPVISKTGECHTQINEYDEHDNKISESYRGLYNEPIAIEKGTLNEIRSTYDEDGNDIKIEFIGLGGRPSNMYNGVAFRETKYSHGYDVTDMRFDSLHRLTRTLASSDSICFIKSTYDSNGNLIAQAYFDEHESPISDHTGVHERVNTFGDRNMIVKVSYLDDFEKPTVGRDGFHATVMKKDSLGRTIERSLYGLDGEPLKNKLDEVYMVKYKYDTLGRTISLTYWKDSLEPMPRWNGTYEERTTFNDDGQPAGYTFYDREGKQFPTSDGFSQQMIIYRPDGTMEERRFLYNDSLVLKTRGVTSGFSIIRYAEDEKGRVNELKFFGKDNQPTNGTIDIDDPLSVHRVTFTYKGNRIVEQSYYELGNDQPSHVVDCLNNDFITTNGISMGRKNSY